MESGRRDLWHVDFLKIILAVFCVCTSLYMFLPVASVCLGPDGRGNAVADAVAVFAFLGGMCLPAPFCNYWLDVYRRKGVALWGVALLWGATLLLSLDVPFAVKWMARMMQGGAYGVFQIAVGSTLLLDLSDTRKRTEAAHVYYWFVRFALIAGPLAGLLLPAVCGVRMLDVAAMGLLVAAAVLVGTVRVPFRAPLEPSLFTFDRFWLPRGLRLFVPLLGTCFLAGVLLGRQREPEFYLFFAVGCWLALLLHRTLLRERLEGEFVVGFVCLTLSAWMCTGPERMEGFLWGGAVLLGCGLGGVTSRYLLSYIRICEHCERGTAQTSYLLGWEGGMLAGYVFSYGAWQRGEKTALPGYIIVGGMLACALFHLWVVRSWYRRNKRK